MISHEHTLASTLPPPAATRAHAGASATAIRHHYDLSNEFYALWLGPEMVYSCALWEAGDTLSSAQLRKLDYHVAESLAAGGRRVLDVGCGWGALLERLTASFAVGAAVGLTLSEAQAASIRARRLPGVEVALESWREHRAAEAYDAIICIGACEHFAHRGLASDQKVAAYREFFSFCHRSLAGRGRLALQTIAYSFRPGHVDPFVPERIFPESELPLTWELLAAADGLFELRLLRNDRDHYVRTAREWLQRLRAARAEAVELIGEARARDYERYLETAAAAFRVGALSLLRATFERIPARAAADPAPGSSPKS